MASRKIGGPVRSNTLDEDWGENVAPWQNVSVYMQAMCGSIRHSASSQRRVEKQPTVTRRCTGMRSGSRPLATFCWALSLSSAASLCAVRFVVLLCASKVLSDTYTLDRAIWFQHPATQVLTTIAARRYANGVYMLSRVSVRPSVRPSQARIVPNELINVGSRKQRRTTAHRSRFVIQKMSAEFQWGQIQCGRQNRWIGKNLQFSNNISLYHRNSAR